MIFQSIEELQNDLKDIVVLEDDNVKILDEAKLREFGIDYLIYAGVLSNDGKIRHLARVYIRNLAKHFGVYPSSTYPLYEAFGKGEVGGFTVPAMNMRTMTYDVAREIFKKAISHEAGAFMFEISRSEMKYTEQNQDEVAVCILAAALKEGYEGPVFLQGDHYQFDAKKFSEYPQGQIDEIELDIKDALSVGFYNIDIDASTLVDLSLKTPGEQQKDNFEMTAILTKFIRKMQPAGITVAVGGEIGHIGDVNSNLADFEAFMEGYMEQLGVEPLNGISKVSVQTGTSHGGVINPDGSLQEMSVDFSVLKSIGKVSREKYKMAGAVQHGASTLSSDVFDKFPENAAVEIHLATGFQNIIFDTMPKVLKEKLYKYIRLNFENEREKDWGDEEFLYKLRKKALGPNKKELWLISEPEKDVIREKLAGELEMLFQKLNIIGTRHTVAKYIGENRI